MDIMQIMQDFKKSVINLADNLPQWSSDEFSRRRTAALSSMFEECGEICGLVSKYQTRKVKGTDLWLTDFESLPEKDKLLIIDKFKDETGDLLWVVTASIHSILNDTIDVCNIVNMYNQIKKEFKSVEQLSNEYLLDDDKVLGIDILIEILDDINIVFTNLDDIDDDTPAGNSPLLLSDICSFLLYLNLKYGISLSDVLLYNMEKLGIRYDKNGNRVDGKL